MVGKFFVFIFFLFGVVAAQTDADKSVLLQQPALQFNVLLEREAVTELVGVVDETQVFPPRRNLSKTLARLPALPASAPKLIAKNFVLRTEPGPEIAGRSTTNFIFESRSPEASVFHFFVDNVWGLRLGFEELDAAGRTTHRAVFKRIDGQPQSLARRNYARYAVNVPLDKIVRHAFGESALPRGFFVVGLKQRSALKPEDERLELRVSNGLSMLILTFSKMALPEAEKLVVRAKGNGYVWVLGNLSHAVLQRCADAIPNDFDASVLLSFLRQNKSIK